LTIPEVDYILEHSGAKLVLVDYEYVKYVKNKNIPYVVCNDTGRVGDPYEDYLGNIILLVRLQAVLMISAQGRKLSREEGWPGLEIEPDENANASLCYT
jgi:hypothetical protein